MEDSLNFNISKSLIEVDRKEEFASLIFLLRGANNYIRFVLEEFASARVLSFSLNGRHINDSICVKSLMTLLPFRQSEDSNSSIVKSLWEWIGVVYSCPGESATSLGH